METITSKRHFRKFYLAITGFSLFFEVMALLILAIHNEATSKGGEIFMIIIGTILALMPFYIVYRSYQNAPIIRVNTNSISFNNAAPFFWRDLEKFEMTGKRRIKFMLGEPKEGVLLKFKGQAEKYILDDMYQNAPEMKRFIQNIVEKTPPKTPANNANLNLLADDSFTYYKGYQLLCFEGIFLWLFLIFIAFFCVEVVWSVGKIVGAVAPMAFGLFIYAMMGFRLYFFGMSQDRLVIRLHNVFWYKKFYPLADIREVVFETHHKMPVCLRVITNNFESKLYPAATIWSKKWMQLKEALEKKNIKVRNECVFYEPFEFKLFN